ncbi:MAG: hypothetical protein ACLTER_20875 [Ruminococcus sp.]
MEEPPESKMTTYDIYREEVMMKESVKNYEAAKEHLTRLLKKMDPEVAAHQDPASNGQKQFITLLL